MNIEVKDIRYQAPHPKAPVSFIAQLYIDGTHVGQCMDAGQGPPINYAPKD
ncbi:hypothetical protein SAMN05661044_00670, partial [Olivibacter domesticus]